MKEKESKPKTISIRNSTAEFLIFTTQAGEENIEVRIEDENIWLTQKLIARLFNVEIPTINEHFKNILSSNELDQDSVIRNFLITATDGKKYNTKHYNLDAIIAIGFKVNSEKAIAFRRWANKIIKEYSLKGYVLDSERLKNGAFFSKKYFESDFDKLIKSIG